VTAITDGYLAAADVGTDLLGAPEVAASWGEPSALAQLSVGGLAGHLARQIFSVEALLRQGPCAEPPISLLAHYARAAWAGADLDDPANVAIRHDAAAEAAAGPAALAAAAGATLDRLRGSLAAQPPDRVVLLPWGPWALQLDDLLTTRLLEITVHCDDLACSVGRPAPALPDDVTDLVVSLLARLAARRHGATAVVRALSRAERAPAVIAAF
jgi:Mycothiol maleylpyruvate isomerase N-terminal domain